MRGKHLYHGIEIHTWAIACFVNPQDCSDRTLKNFTGQLMKISGETGMPIRSEPCFCRYAKKAEDVSITTHLEKTKPISGLDLQYRVNFIFTHANRGLIKPGFQQGLCLKNEI